MRMVFWQNCLSPHQLPYIVHLLDDERVDEVVIVASEELCNARRNMGWNIIKYKGIERCKTFIHPIDRDIEELLSFRKEDSYHFFSGIRAYDYVFKCLQMSMDYNLHRGIITERPNRYDFKRDKANAKPYWMHRLRFWLQDWKYARKIQYVFAMGEEAVNYYKSLGIKWEVFPFCYCTYSPSSIAAKSPKSIPVQYAFCGSLSKRKDPVTIVRSLAILKNRNQCNIRIIGDGPLLSTLKKETSGTNHTDNIQLLGTISQKDIPLHMQLTDVLILPSLYDGWGAVVNEALQSGCYVIVTNECGAADLIKQDKRLGQIFRPGNRNELAMIMEYVNSHISEIRELRSWRKQWAENHISGNIVAKYMVDCICGDHRPEDKPLWAL